MISWGFLDLEDFFVFDLLMDFYGLDMFFFGEDDEDVQYFHADFMGEFDRLWGYPVTFVGWEVWNLHYQLSNCGYFYRAGHGIHLSCYVYQRSYQGAPPDVGI